MRPMMFNGESWRNDPGRHLQLASEKPHPTAASHRDPSSVAGTFTAHSWRHMVVVRPDHLRGRVVRVGSGEEPPDREPIHPEPGRDRNPRRGGLCGRVGHSASRPGRFRLFIDPPDDFMAL